MKYFYFSVSLLALALSGGPAYAAEPPDAGRLLQEQRQAAPSLPKPAPSFSVQTPAMAAHEPGGPQVKLQSIVINGNSRIADDVLLAALGDVKGKRFDLSGLKTLADRITAFYHAQDYPFARAFVPAQSMAGGQLVIEVIEGRYGERKIEGEDSRAVAAQKFLGDLKRDAVIEGRALERTTLILDDQPGYKFTPIIRPGQDIGTGDLTVLMQREKPFGGHVGIDNFGNRYTGRLRGQASLYADSPFMFGDRVAISTIYTEEDMWYGSAGYSAPLGYSGLRGNVGYTQTDYQLGKEFSALDAHGTAQIASAGLSYPLIRTQAANLFLVGTYQHKWLNDEQGVTGTDDKKSSDTLPAGLNFDMRDNFAGGGTTYGGFSWTHGILDLDSGLSATDGVTARSNGAFDKVNLDVARLQATPVESLSLFGRVSGQLAGDNLDSSEDFGLGGPNGVRAYPTGESYGDEGGLAQAELRYAVGNVTPYVFYDYGYIKTNHDQFSAGDNDRSIGGAGLGVRANYKGWNADASAAWRTNGGEPESDSRHTMPQLWFTVGYTF